MASTVVFTALIGAVLALPVQTDTGFVYPVGTKEPYLYSGWLEAYPAYPFPGYYHIGQDMESAVDTKVYAIADGEIIRVSDGSAWNSVASDKNYGIFVKHKLNDGKEFVALYGHIRPIDAGLMRNGIIDPPVKVYSGVAFATVGPFSSIPHLHFGIYPGLNYPLSNWGRMPIDQLGANGFVNPIEWITTKQPFPFHGLQASYYNEPIYRNNLETVATPDVVRIDPNLNFAWHINPGQRPAEIINDGWWSGDWKGYINIVEQGTYRFRLESDDGSWLYIDGAMLINNG
ncbi:peptidoglycan DD-metalloendopeptidase family protein, partial [Patescibacteria group bacterium]|nr:peptidoglycan DD-metalloendopeptidase family protein [Patescibacteria group bacterium]